MMIRKRRTETEDDDDADADDAMSTSPDEKICMAEKVSGRGRAMTNFLVSWPKEQLPAKSK
jgi:hypothetical protein